MITFNVPGEPVAKGRPRATTINGQASMYTPKKTANYENLVALAAQQMMVSTEHRMLEGPLGLSFTATFSIPKSWTKKRLLDHSIYPESVTKKPDIDNLLKALGDGMNGVVYADDSQIAGLTDCCKVYGAKPGVTVKIWELAK